MSEYKPKWTDVKIFSFGKFLLTPQGIKTLGKTWPLAGATAYAELEGEAIERVTATRVITGAILLGPLGAVVGALAKKSEGRKAYLVVTLGDGTMLTEEGDPSKLPGMRVMAERICSAGRGEYPYENSLTAQHTRI